MNEFREVPYSRYNAKRVYWKNCLHNHFMSFPPPQKAIPMGFQNQKTILDRTDHWGTCKFLRKSPDHLEKP